jgi:23S rRNA pseudouridine2605 synthase
VAGEPVGDAAVRALRAGVELADGMTAPASVRGSPAIASSSCSTKGRKRQVRRMCEAVGHPWSRSSAWASAL